jgi:fused signal recognition particle receptor
MEELPSLLHRFTRGLQKTREAFLERMAHLLTRPKIDPEFLEELEATMLGADLGMATVRELMDAIPGRVREPQELLEFLQRQVAALLSVPQGEISTGHPHVVLVLGVNGSGKTTTIGKLAFQATQQGKKVLLAAADTFRAAATTQLQIWGKRAGAQVIAHQAGGDPAAVVFDALHAAKAREADLLYIDTAGRLHTKKNLMEELKKIHRVIARESPTAPQETLLTLDATTGLNALVQARQFHQAIGLTGLVITKLDGTAKGGAVVGIVAELQIPVRYVGVGEGLHDLHPFSPSTFAAALFSREP